MTNRFRAMPVGSFPPVAQYLDDAPTTRMPEKGFPQVHRVVSPDATDAMTAVYPGALPLQRLDSASARRLEATVQLARGSVRRALTRRIHVPTVFRMAALIALCGLSALVIVLLRGGTGRESRIAPTAASSAPAPSAPAEEGMRPASTMMELPADVTVPASLTAAEPASKPAKSSRHSSRHKKHAPTPIEGMIR